MEAHQKNLSYLMWLLSRRDYPRFQLEDKLKKRGVTPPDIKKLLEHLIEAGWYNEGRFKKVRTRQLIKLGFGPRMLKARLGQQRLKLDNEEISVAYEEVGTTPAEQIRLLIEKYHKRYSSKSSEARILKQKISQALMRKGYTSDLIFSEL